MPFGFSNLNAHRIINPSGKHQISISLFGEILPHQRYGNGIIIPLSGDFRCRCLTDFFFVCCQKCHALPFGRAAFQLFPKRSKDCVPYIQLQILVCCGIAVCQHMKPHNAIGNAPLDICRINARPEDTDQNAPHKGCHPIFPLFFPKGFYAQSPQNQCFHALPPFLLLMERV